MKYLTNLEETDHLLTVLHADTKIHFDTRHATELLQDGSLLTSLKRYYS